MNWFLGMRYTRPPLTLLLPSTILSRATTRLKPIQPQLTRPFTIRQSITLRHTRRLPQHLTTHPFITQKPIRPPRLLLITPQPLPTTENRPANALINAKLFVAKSRNSYCCIFYYTIFFRAFKNKYFVKYGHQIHLFTSYLLFRLINNFYFKLIFE